MPVTVDIPPHLLEKVRQNALIEGISPDEWIVRVLNASAETSATLETKIASTIQPQISSKFGRMPDAVAYIADDFDATPDDFKDYIE